MASFLCVDSLALASRMKRGLLCKRQDRAPQAIVRLGCARAVLYGLLSALCVDSLALASRTRRGLLCKGRTARCSEAPSPPSEIATPSDRLSDRRSGVAVR
ncbi:uncharacterized protein LAESUDRAFT_719822 [Laetiporus sulphureus 93-53]|uniref:Uncharacterized protein n=1 Tax=Laetiporus sulphureus 93-53 TaxID=1314785 RepID=A0A165HLD2_9APHY|nr:uncharacterized protein LAESUDRAFT_719822 [Laetiporus sulphureus 93-53]KZT11881.1 hypothetical protein LAESUDRAFT_719822 [Laetiporus sulphureus 93-53]